MFVVVGSVVVVINFVNGAIDKAVIISVFTDIFFIIVERKNGGIVLVR